MNITISVFVFHQDHLANREAIRAAETQRQEEEEEKQKQMASHKKTVMKLRKEKQEEIFRYGFDVPMTIHLTWYISF